MSDTPKGFWIDENGNLHRGGWYLECPFRDILCGAHCPHFGTPFFWREKLRMTITCSGVGEDCPTFFLDRIDAEDLKVEGK